MIRCRQVAAGSRQEFQAIEPLILQGQAVNSLRSGQRSPRGEEPTIAVEELPSKPKDVELSDQSGEKPEEGLPAKEAKAELPDFFPSHGLTTAGDSCQYCEHVLQSSAVFCARMHVTHLGCVFYSAEADKLRETWGFNELEEKSTPKWVTYLHMVSCSNCFPFVKGSVRHTMVTDMLIFC